jgi:hypothetical protein
MPNAQLESARRVGWGRRLSYAFIGLVAGNAAMDAWLLTSDLPVVLHTASAHHLPVGLLLSRVLWVMLLYGADSFIGWLIVGLPLVFSVPPQVFARLPWIVVIALGAAFGPALLLLAQAIVALIVHGHFTVAFFLKTGNLRFLSLILSGVGFSTYCLLIRRQLTTGVL